MITINLIDDHKVVSDGLTHVFGLEEDFLVSEVATSWRSGLAQLVDHQPDVLVLDYSLDPHKQEKTGLDVAKEVMDSYPNIKILMLTMHTSPDIIVPVVEAGVHGYMLKSEKRFDIVRAIRYLHQEGHYFSPEIAPQLAMDMKRYRENYIDITDREQEVLEVMFRGHTAKEIADILCISPKTVETHRKHLLGKFDARNSLHLIHKALSKGYLRQPAPGESR
ncbi:MAG: response regulator transcription factor [Bacteroidia bacterium]|nr:response regulator transcription factor [Bacteroidia bacterium]